MNKFFEMQMKLHPSIQALDLLKFCYQSAFGAEHMISDTERMKAYLHSEFESTEPGDAPLSEQISNTYSRVNIQAWKQHGLSEDRLFELFILSIEKTDADKSAFESILNDCLLTAKGTEIGKRLSLQYPVIQEYMRGELHPVHHSDIYRNNENPHYRLIKTEFLKDII